MALIPGYKPAGLLFCETVEIKTAARRVRYWTSRPSLLAWGELERNPQSQPNRTATVDTFLGVGIEQAPKVRVRFEISNGRLQCCGIYAHIEVADLREGTTASSVVSVRLEQAMIEEILYVSSECRNDAVSEMKIFMDSQINAPSTGSS
jgi:hypothetical protein